MLFRNATFKLYIIRMFSDEHYLQKYFIDLFRFWPENLLFNDSFETHFELLFIYVSYVEALNKTI